VKLRAIVLQGQPFQKPSAGLCANLDCIVSHWYLGIEAALRKPIVMTTS
jgi:hypothetical protein